MGRNPICRQPGHDGTKSATGVFLEFLVRQWSSIVSVARASHLISDRNGSTAPSEKNFTAFSPGWPNGLRRPFATRTGISCAANPKYHPVSSAVNRAGMTLRFRNFSFSCCMEMNCDQFSGDNMRPAVKSRRPVRFSSARNRSSAESIR